MVRPWPAASAASALCSPNVSFRALQALTTHRREQYTVFERRSTPATQIAPRSGHSAWPARTGLEALWESTSDRGISSASHMKPGA